jgi:hypothetical protein
VIICAKCLEVKRKHPNRTARELSPVASFEATTMINGTALCNAHATPKSKENK